MEGNIFGGFTPVKWDSSGWAKADDSLKTCFCTLTNLHNVQARKAEYKEWAIDCDAKCDPCFGDIAVREDCNANTDSGTAFGFAYTNDTGVYGEMVFTGSENFQVSEIEVFEITN
jgi:hypothetical protein